MENLWVEHNGLLSPVPFSGSNRNLLSRHWVPNIQSFTLDTFIQSFTQRVQLPEPIYNIQPSIPLDTTYSNSHNSIQCMAHYRAYFNSYWGSYPATSLLTLNNLYCEEVTLRTPKWTEEKIQHYDYSNPYFCEFCAACERRINQNLELSEQRFILRMLKLNPFELTDGIKKILDWPWEQCSNNLSDIDGITSLQIDEQKKKIKELFPNIVMDVHDSFWLEGSSRSYRPKSNLETLRNRMAEFVCIGPLNNNWYTELIHDFWARDRPRMPYTQNFENNNAIKHKC